MFDHNPFILLREWWQNAFLSKALLLRVLKPKGQGHSKSQKQMPWGTINIPPKNKISRKFAQ